MSASIRKNGLNVADIGSYLLMVFAFTFPIYVALGNLVAALIILLWLFEGRFAEKWQEARNNPVVVSFLIFVAIHLLGMLWTTDLAWGLVILKKQWKFLLLPIFMSFVRREHVRYYILAFLLAISMSELLSYAIWFGLIPPFGSATAENPTPFMSHISYNPFLAFAVYLLLENLLFGETLSRWQRFAYGIFVCTMTVNMFITGGRAGQIMYFLVLALVAFQFFKKNLLKALLFCGVFIPAIFLLSYNSSQIFHERVDLAVYQVSHFEEMRKDVAQMQVSSVGLRLTYFLNSLEIIRNHPLFGVGTGDFRLAYAVINQKNSPGIDLPDHPHNMYLLVGTQLGLVGLLIFLSIFRNQIKQALKSDDPVRQAVGIGMPLLFMVIMLSDTYLLGHYTTLLFVFFSAILYKNYEPA